MATQTLQNFNYAIPIAKSDTVASPTFPASGGREPDAVWVGGAGVVICVFDDESTVAITVTAGTLLPIRCKRINSTSTTATLFVALWQV